MSRWLLWLLVIVPVAELFGIMLMVRWIGGWLTFALIVLTGIAGAWLARSLGRKVWLDAQRQLQSGEMPGRALLDGLCVLAGGVLLMLPGFLTDVLGAALLLPFFRPFFRLLLFGLLERFFRGGRLTIRRW